VTGFSVCTIPIADLRDHPRNSNRHGDRQLEVLATRWRALGWYKNVVVAEWEGTTTLLAGHGIVAGARAAGATEAPCHVRNIDPLSPEALDILEGDNTVADLAEPDLHERLRNLVELDAAGRLGNVGYDDGALDRLKAELQAEDFAQKHGPLDYTPQSNEDQAGAGSAWGAMGTSDRVRLVWGDIEAAMDYDVYTRVKDTLDAAFDAGGSYHGEMERLLRAGCDACG